MRVRWHINFALRAAVEREFVKLGRKEWRIFCSMLYQEDKSLLKLRLLDIHNFYFRP
jgi:hypothetical protein